MKKIKVVSVFGTRPEAIKMAPLVKELAAREQIESYVCVTAQHRQMLDQVLCAFDLTPDFDLDIMEQRQTLALITCKSIAGLDDIFKDLQPDIVLVHGDTTTTFSAALAAFYNKVRVGHVEAGLRSFDLSSPYPEEANRRLTDAISDIYFAPTRQNRRNLEREGINKNIFVTGNTVIDALKTTVKQPYIFEEPKLNGIDLSKGKSVLLTSHRRENYGEPMEHIFSAVRELALMEDAPLFIFPVHLSPYVRELSQKYLANLEKVLLIDPVGVMDMHNLMARVSFVITDSGGLQEEAPSLGKPVLVLRRETERPEAVEAGTAKVIGTDQAPIIQAALRLLNDQAEYERMSKAVNPYGDGDACRRIVDDILYFFGVNEAPAEDFCVRD